MRPFNGIARLYRWLQRSLHLQPEDKERLRQEFFTVGTHYYVAARYAFFGGMIPTAGNLFHLAIEMYLKAYLSLRLSELERRRLGHSLRRIWRRFKRDVRDPALDQFDSTIKTLHKFETIPYPERMIRLGAEINFSLARPIRRSGRATATWLRKPRYEVCVHEIDELVAVLVPKIGLNPTVFRDMLSEDGKAYLKRDNPTSIWNA
jgi:HEPN domain-containing protein